MQKNNWQMRQEIAPNANANFKRLIKISGIQTEKGDI